MAILVVTGALGLFVLGFVIWTARRAYVSPILHPLRWTLVCLVCAPVATFDSSTGEVGLEILTATILPVSCDLEEKASIVSIAFPAGAFLFL